MVEPQRIRAEIRANNPDPSDDDRDALADRWAEEFDAGIRRRVRQPRGGTGSLVFPVAAILAQFGKDRPMAQALPATERTRRSPEDLMATLDRLRAQLRADNPDMSEDDWEALADRLAEDVNEGLRNVVRRSRGESV